MNAVNTKTPTHPLAMAAGLTEEDPHTAADHRQGSIKRRKRRRRIRRNIIRNMGVILVVVVVGIRGIILGVVGVGAGVGVGVGRILIRIS